MQEIWWVREMLRIYGYEDVPVSSGYEYITRGTQRGALTEREQAELYVRDALHCLAYGYPSINIGATEDWADSYNGTIYGGGGFVRRNPLLTPKPSYVAWATMTRMLDGARYVRYLDTGSRSLYVLEFSTCGGTVYAVWTVRGSRRMTVAFGDGTSASLTDSMGNRRELPTEGGKATLEATPAPAYLVTSRPLEGVRPGAVAHAGKPSADAVVVCDFSDPAAWDIDHGTRKRPKRSHTSVPGTFELVAVEDAERGTVGELRMAPAPDASKLAARYIELRPKTPLTVERPADGIGWWLKGNSCWGGVLWEFLDANGEKYVTTRGRWWDPNRWNWFWSRLNYDGWCFIFLDLPTHDAQGFPGRFNRNWGHRGGDNDGRVQFPITLTRIVVRMRDWQVYLTDMVPAQSRSIRLGPMLAGNGFGVRAEQKAAPGKPDTGGPLTADHE